MATTSSLVWRRLPGDEFEQLGIDPKEYAKTYLEGFDYKIGDVTVDEDKGVATAEVSITCKSMNKIVEDFSTQYQEKVAALDTVPSDDELYKMAGQVMVDVTKATEPRKTTVIFKYTCNDDGEWSADDSVNSEMMDAIVVAPSFTKRRTAASPPRPVSPRGMTKGQCRLVSRHLLCWGLSHIPKIQVPPTAPCRTFWGRNPPSLMALADRLQSVGGACR